jgi:hypothetical protein
VPVLKTPIEFAVGSVNQMLPFKIVSCVGPPLVLLLSKAEYSWMLERSCRSSKGSSTSGLPRNILRQARFVRDSIMFGLSRCPWLIMLILEKQICMDWCSKEERDPVQ